MRKFLQGKVEFPKKTLRFLYTNVTFYNFSFVTKTKRKKVIVINEKEREREKVEKIKNEVLVAN